MAQSAEARRFAQAVQMSEDGITLMRQNLRRRHPGASKAEIDRLLAEWLVSRPLDAPAGWLRRRWR
jgi:hypothetical protein